MNSKSIEAASMRVSIIVSFRNLTGASTVREFFNNRTILNTMLYSQAVNHPIQQQAYTCMVYESWSGCMVVAVSKSPTQDTPNATIQLAVRRLAIKSREILKSHDIGLPISIPAWISNYAHYNVWDEFTYPFPNFNGCTVEVREWISNFILHFTGHVIICPCWN